MSINCFFGDYTSHANEQRMLDQLLSQLHAYWGQQHSWIYLIYNAMWNGQEIDLVCITEHAIIVIDLKNYSGALTGQENGEWLMDVQSTDSAINQTPVSAVQHADTHITAIQNPATSSIVVKGGGQINPFVQIRKNRYAVMDWLNQNKRLSQENIGHMAGLIVFSEIRALQLQLSYSVKQWFHVTDLAHISHSLANIRSDEIHITEAEAQDIVQQLNLKPYTWTAGRIIESPYFPFGTLNSGPDSAASATPYVDLLKLSPSPVTESQLHLDIKRMVYAPLLVMILVGGIFSYYFIRGSTNDSGIYHVLMSNLVPGFGDANSNSSQLLALISPSLVDRELQADKEIAQDQLNIPPEPPKIDPKQPVQQLSDFYDLSTMPHRYYGFQIAETSLTQAMKILNHEKLASKDHYYAGASLTQRIDNLYYPESQANRLHQKYGILAVKDLNGFKLYFDKNNKLTALVIQLKAQDNQVMKAYIKQYKKMGYKYIGGDDAFVGNQHALFKKSNDDYLVIANPHMSHEMYVLHTNKAHYLKYKDRFILNTRGDLVEEGREI